MENGINKYQYSSPRGSILHELEIAMTVAESLTRYALSHDQGELWYRSWQRELELAEQIAMVKQFPELRPVGTP